MGDLYCDDESLQILLVKAMSTLPFNSCTIEVS